MSDRNSTAGGRATALWMLVRPTRADLSGAVLPLVSFAVITAVVVSVMTLARTFWQVPDPQRFGQYRILAVAMLAVMVVPVSTLGSSAARLSARRREDRLATLRLIGASPSWVRWVALVVAGWLAAAGAVLGALCSVVIAPVLAPIPIAGEEFGLSRAWLSPWTVVLVLGVAAALVSAAANLRQVMVSPLGVRMRTVAPRMRWLRLLISLIIVAGGVLVLHLTSASWGAVGITGALVLVILAVMAVLNLLGYTW